MSKQSFLDNHTKEILNKYENAVYPVIDYVKSASYLSLSYEYKNALKVLDIGLKHYPKHEELIRAKFSFASFHRDLLYALEIATDYDEIFEDDEYDPLTQALDLIRYSFNFNFPHQEEVNDQVVDSILKSFSEDKQYDTTTLILKMIQDFNFPYIGLGFAKHFAKQDDDLAYLVLGGSYLRGFHVEKDLIKAKLYLTRAIELGCQEAVDLLNELDSLPSMS